MMTFEELWEKLKTNLETKATIEEAEKSYKLFKKIENLIVADIETKLAESEDRVKDLEFRNKNLEHSLSVAPNANAGQRARIIELKGINHKLKQQLAEKDKEIEYQESMKILAVKNQNQKAIEKLEKVKNFVYGRTYLANYIDQQIKELKGEK